MSSVAFAWVAKRASNSSAVVSRVSTGGFDWETPRALFAQPDLADLMHGYGVTADGRRFLVPTRNPEAAVTEINIVLNWLEELEGR